MKFSLPRNTLLRPLQHVVNSIEKNNTLPILSNVLFVIGDNRLTLTATDLEVELISFYPLEINNLDKCQLTIPARKLLDICVTLPEEATLNFTVEGAKVIIKSNQSRFSLSTLPAEDFPNIETAVNQLEFSISEKELRFLIERTQFTMAQKDVRYFLNGLLLELDKNSISTVATDGHRLAMCTLTTEANVPTKHQVIIPRKAISELLRLLENSDEEVTVSLSENHLRVNKQFTTFTSKLIEGNFPDYNMVIPKTNTQEALINRELFKQVLTRAAVLNDDKFSKGIRLNFKKNILQVSANNSQHEEAEDELAIQYEGEPLEIGFNVRYLTDILNTLPDELIKISLRNPETSCLIESKQDDGCIYVVMPMRL